MYDLWTLPFVLCDLYIAMDVICSTASIFNLVAISIDRLHDKLIWSAHESFLIFWYNTGTTLCLIR